MFPRVLASVVGASGWFCSASRFQIYERLIELDAKIYLKCATSKLTHEAYEFYNPREAVGKTSPPVRAERTDWFRSI